MSTKENAPERTEAQTTMESLSGDYSIEDASQFLSCLFPGVKEFVFQTFDDNSDRKNPKLARTIRGTLEECWPKLVRLNKQGAGVFVTTNEIAPGKPRQNKHVTAIRAVFADYDQRTVTPPEPMMLPHAIVESSPDK